MRKKVKLLLLLTESQTCPLCQKRKATDLHEIVCPSMGDSKYHPLKEELAEWVYTVYNCVLLCNVCNVTIANSRRDDLLRLKTSLYGIECVMASCRGIAGFLDIPSSRMPASLDFEGKTYKIL